MCFKCLAKILSGRDITKKFDTRRPHNKLSFVPAESRTCQLAVTYHVMSILAQFGKIKRQFVRSCALMDTTQLELIDFRQCRLCLTLVITWRVEPLKRAHASYRKVRVRSCVDSDASTSFLSCCCINNKNIFQPKANHPRICAFS